MDPNNFLLLAEKIESSSRAGVRIFGMLHYEAVGIQQEGDLDAVVSLRPCSW